MTILVTGGAGFIGYHLTRQLIEDGHDIISIDNLSDYYDVSLKKDRLKQLKGRKFKFHKIDILNYGDLEAVAKKTKIDVIIHMAAIAGVRYSLEHGIEYVRSNYEGTFNIFELARHFKIPKVLYASSSSVYGASKDYPTTELTDTNKPIAIYGATKKATEVLAYSYQHLFGVSSIGLRFFTVYGPWGRPDMALFIFTKAIIENESINVNNNGEMTRDFTFVEDIVSGIIGSIGYHTKYDIFNLGSAKQITLIEFVKLIEKRIGKRAKMNMMPMQMGDVKDSLADVTKARKAFGYQPKVFPEEGIARFISWYRSYYNV